MIKLKEDQSLLNNNVNSNMLHIYSIAFFFCALIYQKSLISEYNDLFIILKCGSKLWMLRNVSNFENNMHGIIFC